LGKKHSSKEAHWGPIEMVANLLASKQHEILRSSTQTQASVPLHPASSICTWQYAWQFFMPPVNKFNMLDTKLAGYG
jgi:hypothetical protein